MTQRSQLRNRINMKQSLTVIQRLGLFTRLIWVVTFSSVALAGILFATASLSYFRNMSELNIEDDEIIYFGGSFINSQDGTVVNRGQVVFADNITNKGTFFCDTCTSGVSYIRSEENQQTKIDGNSPLLFHDLVIDNPQGVVVKNEIDVKNSLTFSNGNLSIDDSYPHAILKFGTTAVVSGASDTQHVIGKVEKSGTGAFVFPIGDGTHLYQVGISGSSVSGNFSAEYFDINPGSALGGLKLLTSLDPTLDAVFSGGFWEITGDQPTQISLYWNSQQNLASWVAGKDSLTIVGWNGLMWVDLGKSSIIGDLASGSVSSPPITPNDYDGFTFGVITTAVLPVEWLSVEATLEGKDGILDWATFSEVNASHYRVERSLDGRDFEDLQMVPAAGTSSSVNQYQYRDEGIALQEVRKVFYRLKQVDADGKFSYSNVVELDISRYEADLQMTLFPNPSSETLNIQVDYPDQAPLRAKIISLNGQTLGTFATGGNENHQIPVSGLADGQYIMVVSNGKQSVSKRFVVKK